MLLSEWWCVSDVLLCTTWHQCAAARPDLSSAGSAQIARPDYVSELGPSWSKESIASCGKSTLYGPFEKCILLLYVFMVCINLCMYLPQAISSPSSIGTEPDHFLCTYLAQESSLESAHVTFGMVVRLRRAALHNLAPVRCGATRLFLGRIGQDCRPIAWHSVCSISTTTFPRTVLQ